jgi:hypothetical protein
MPTIRNIVVSLPYLSHPTLPIRKQHCLFATSSLNSRSTLLRTTNRTADVRRLRFPSNARNVQIPNVRQVQPKQRGEKTRTEAHGPAVARTATNQVRSSLGRQFCGLCCRPILSSSMVSMRALRGCTASFRLRRTRIPEVDSPQFFATFWRATGFCPYDDRDLSPAKR